MSNKLADISNPLVQRYNFDKAAAENFVEQMFQVLTEGLHRDKLIKIKGLGAFKITTVGARESIDVNTGERILIESREKVSFTPDSTMKDYVNRPFAQFETVIINEGVDIDRLSQTDEQTIEEEPMEVDSTIHEVEKDVEFESRHITEPSTEYVALAADAEIEDITEQLSKEDFHADVEKEHSPVTIPIPTVQEQHEAQIPKELVAEVQPASIEEDEDALSSRSNHSILAITLGVMFGLLLIACCGGVYFFMTELKKRDLQIEQLAQLMKASQHAKVMKHVKADSIVKSEKEEETKQTINKKDSVKLVAPSRPAQEVIHMDEASNSYDALNQNDIRVRTGAYRIVGVQTTITVQAGQTLQSLSRFYLGPDMECYVEVLNGKKEVKAGDKLKIPELKLKKKH